MYLNYLTCFEVTVCAVPWRWVSQAHGVHCTQVSDELVVYGSLGIMTCICVLAIPAIFQVGKYVFTSLINPCPAKCCFSISARGDSQMCLSADGKNSNVYLAGSCIDRESALSPYALTAHQVNISFVPHTFSPYALTVSPDKF